MKTTDLMIGDLVFFNKEEPHYRPVIAIDEYYICEGYTNRYYDKDCFIPIPLTEEILQKNGFVGVELTDSYELNTDYYEIEVWKYSDGLWVVSVQWIEFSSTPESKATVSYVHELQHLLRLCGIEKEIML